MPSQKRKIGDVGEKIAADYLEKNGCQIIERNYQKPWGEIDIIAQDKTGLIFIEVKTREKQKTGKAFSPEDNVHFAKQQRLIKTAETYLSEKDYPEETDWQIDVISVELNWQTRKASLRHFKNAVWE